MYKYFDTIVAQATPPGRGGIGIIRLSGPDVINLIPKILNKNIKKRVATYCNFFDSDGQIIDFGIAIFFPAPKSFTGEDILELHGHGGQAVLSCLLQRIINLGVRFARPGEFSQRAFLNGKLDLIQAESIADLINATNEQAVKNAIRSLQGKFSEQINEIVTNLINIRVKIEAFIDFDDDSYDSKEDERQLSILQNYILNEVNIIVSKIKNLISEANQGIMVKDGITLLIAGDVNAGKSSLFNLLSGNDLAIVTNIPGTTRDVLRVNINLNGLSINLLDTAGLRDVSNIIENEGIKKALIEAKTSDHILYMFDVNKNNDINKFNFYDIFLKDNLNDKNKVTIIYNKIDLLNEKPKILNKINKNGFNCIYISVKNKIGIELLKNHITEVSGYKAICDTFSARLRHLISLKKANQYLENIITNNYQEIDLIAEELKIAQNSLEEIVGTITTDDLLDKIFTEFCIGK